MMRSLPVLLAVSLLLAPVGAAQGGAASAVPAPAPTPDAELLLLAGWMAGTFDTFAQVDRDEKANAPYKHLRAVMQIVPAELPELSGASGGKVFYVEQAAADALDKPYRQRLYLLFRRDGVLVNRIFRLKDPAPLVGAASDRSKLRLLTPDGALAEEGCDLVWARVDGARYQGAAGLGGTCRTAWRGATKAVSIVQMTPDSITSLDLGFDDAGAQKWGPPPGAVGHVFVRRGASRAAPPQTGPP